MPQQGALVHPGRPCGPCSLCGQKSAYYTHPSSWKEGAQRNLYDLGILHELELLSTDEELKTLVENPRQCIPAEGR